MPIPVRALGAATLLAARSRHSACAPVRTHQGYVIDRELVDAIQPGVDNANRCSRRSAGRR
jgi:hypothetical protein